MQGSMNITEGQTGGGDIEVREDDSPIADIDHVFHAKKWNTYPSNLDFLFLESYGTILTNERTFFTF
jgi:hypothetical protein